MALEIGRKRCEVLKFEICNCELKKMLQLQFTSGKELFQFLVQ